MALSGWVCVVTGASRGIGKGVALQLSEARAIVYITGRHEQSLRETATEVEARGGTCVPVVCDSTKEDDIKQLFERITREQSGRLDILVNNAYAGVQSIFSNMGKRFWEMEPSMWDTLNNAGLRGHYLCSVYAARLMVPAGRGLMVVVSSFGGLRKLFNVPYGVGKAAVRPPVCMSPLTSCLSVSLYLTQSGELQLTGINLSLSLFQIRDAFCTGETPEFSGKCIVELAKDKSLISLTGKVLMTCDLSRRYNIRDVDGCSIVDYTSFSYLLSKVPYLSWLSYITPSFLRIPKWVLTLSASKF
ncbi:DHRS1 reductase, partial [Amia calva]|nr:DHRS1 reductase [Amia calva]